jgi:3-deoxy-D-arabino-heptulosonate 7-phosphate (DAHP) synthase
MIETHCTPDEAWSDAAQQVTPARLKEILMALELRQSDDPDSIYKAGIQNLRHQIDELDTTILDTIAQRMKIANSIGELKKNIMSLYFNLNVGNRLKKIL